MRYHYTMYPHLIRFRNKHITASSALAAGSDTRVRHDTYNLTFAGKRPLAWAKISILHEKMDTLGFEPRAFRMRSGCDTTTPCALCPWRWPLAYIAKNENFLFVRGAGQECGSRGNVTWRFQAMSDIDSGKHKERHRQRHPPWGSNPRPQG
jgi:hypothetical protein